MAWLADDFIHPERLDLATGHHLRDTEIDYPAVMGSGDPLWAKYGELSGRPPEHALDELVGSWLAERWDFRAVDNVL